MKSVKTSEMRKVNGGCIEKYYRCRRCNQKRLTSVGMLNHLTIKHKQVFPWIFLQYEEVKVSK